MEFEFDDAKSGANQKKHGIDFIEAQKLWQDPDALELPARSQKEVRALLISKHDGKIWAAIFTERDDKIRLISVRRARINEEKIYEQPDQDDSTES
jgi:hypothetical protein